jgi:hypothetical protein
MVVSKSALIYGQTAHICPPFVLRRANMKCLNSKLIASNLNNSRKLWNTVNRILHRKSFPVLPSFDCV